MNLSQVNTTLNSPTCSSDRTCLCSDGVYVGLCLYHTAIILCFLLIFPIHSWLIWQRQQRDWRTTPAQFLGLSINILEAIFCTEGLMYVLNFHVFKNNSVENVLTVLFAFAWLGRPLLQTWTCVEIYMAVVYATKYARFRALKYKVVIVGAVWTISLCYGLYLQLLLIDYIDDPVILAVLCCSAAVMSYCCTSILWRLRRPGPSEGQRVGQDRQKQRAFLAIAKLLGFLLLTYAPLIVMSFVSVYIDSRQFICNVSYALNAVSVFGVIVMSLHTLYVEGNLPCFRDTAGALR